MYPSTVQYTAGSPTVGSLASLTSSYTESMPVNSGTSAWAAYDIFTTAPSGVTTPGPEIMFKVQEENACDSCSTKIGTGTFDGTSYTVYLYGASEYIFVPAQAVPSGTVNLLSVFDWMIANGYMTSSYTIGLVGFGWEICSTGGVPETFSVTHYSLSKS